MSHSLYASMTVPLSVFVSLVSLSLASRSLLCRCLSASYSPDVDHHKDGTDEDLETTLVISKLLIALALQVAAEYCSDSSSPAQLVTAKAALRAVRVFKEFLEDPHCSAMMAMAKRKYPGNAR